MGRSEVAKDYDEWTIARTPAATWTPGATRACISMWDTINNLAVFDLEQAGKLEKVWKGEQYEYLFRAKETISLSNIKINGDETNVYDIDAGWYVLETQELTAIISDPEEDLAHDPELLKDLMSEQ